MLLILLCSPLRFIPRHYGKPTATSGICRPCIRTMRPRPGWALIQEAAFEDTSAVRDPEVRCPGRWGADREALRRPGAERGAGRGEARLAQGRL